MRAVVNLHPDMPHRASNGHPWVFDNEIQSVDGVYDPGDIVEVRRKGRLLGLGYINPNSSITVRMLTMRDEPIDEDFFRERIERALTYRKKAFAVSDFRNSPCGFRLIYSEADFLPGLVVDIFAGFIVFQTLTLGMERRKELIADLLQEMVSPKGVYERNDASVRELEGLELRAGFWGQAFDPLIEIDENGVTMLVDVQKGQKTGYFLDQSDNRFYIRPFAEGARVLDAFSYSAGFGLSAALGGAIEVTCLDISEAALQLGMASARKSGLEDRLQFRAENVFDVLRAFERDKVQFDFVMLDPPAFARSRKTVARALAGYKEVNLRALKLVRDGGYLCTSSCSQHVTPEEFDSMLKDAASDAGKVLRIIEKRSQRKDHPIILGIPETEYLKFRMCQVFYR